MNQKLLITLPCNVRELKEKLETCDRCDVVISQYDGEGDSLYVIPVEEEVVSLKQLDKVNNFVQTLEEANKATQGSKMVFK